jgi:hypothetical protein
MRAGWLAIMTPCLVLMAAWGTRGTPVAPVAVPNVSLHTDNCALVDNELTMYMSVDNASEEPKEIIFGATLKYGSDIQGQRVDKIVQAGVSRLSVSSPVPTGSRQSYSCRVAGIIVVRSPSRGAVAVTVPPPPSLVTHSAPQRPS